MHDDASTQEEVAVDIDVLANDRPVYQRPRITALTAPAHGQAELLADGTVRYLPNVDFVGTDSFGYTIVEGEDGASEEATTTVSVTVASDMAVFAPATLYLVDVLPQDIVAADFDGDARLDLLVGGEEELLVVPNAVGPDGAPDFPLAQGLGFAFARHVAAADLDGDGRLEAIAQVAEETGVNDRIVVLPNVGGAGELAFGALVTPVGDASLIGNFVIADWDLDGRVDLMWREPSALRVALNRTSVGGPITFAAPVSLPVAGMGVGAGWLAAGDLDDDGAADLVAVGQGGLTVWHNDALPGGDAVALRLAYAVALPYVVIGGPRLADVDGDHRTDVIFVDDDTNEVVVFHGGALLPGEVAFWSETFAVEAYLFSVAAADFDGDGDDDVAAVSGGGYVDENGQLAEAGQVELYSRQGRWEGDTPEFRFRGDTPAGPYGLAATAADLDGDGRADLAIANGNDGFTVLLAQ